MTHTLSESSGHLHRVHHHRKLVADAREAILQSAREVADAHYDRLEGHGAPPGQSLGSTPPEGGAP